MFVLPLEGGVGQEFRHDEIVELTKYIDKNYGPGQTIVLYINSNGGLVLENHERDDVAGGLQVILRIEESLQ